jgi:hypothetical protein
MDHDHIAEFPASCRETLHSALRAAFGSIRIDKIALISGGVSGAFPFRVDIGDRRYVVRVEGPIRALRNLHQYDSMLIAAFGGHFGLLAQPFRTRSMATMGALSECVSKVRSFRGQQFRYCRKNSPMVDT